MFVMFFQELQATEFVKYLYWATSIYLSVSPFIYIYKTLSFCPTAFSKAYKYNP